MKNFISVCIPFYNTFDLTKKTVDVLVKCEFINEIIISDNCSIKSFEYNNRKVRIYRNAKNIGALKNKFKVVQYAKNEWVYLLDSDNFIEPKMFKKLYNFLNKGKFNEDFIYSPSKLILENINLDKKLNNKIIKYNFKDKIIDLKLVEKYLGKVKYFDWFLNTGNYVVNKKKYIKCGKQMFRDKELKYPQADSMVFSYYWLNSGKKIHILDNFYYFHRLLNNSYSHDKNNNKSVKIYKNLFLKKENIFYKKIINFFQ
jgi:glycosyltransferase involved in cell wall biosynthesis